MNACTLKRGIFSLRACGNPVAEHCSTCLQAVCQEHLAPLADEVLCVSCYAARGAQDESSDEREDWERPGFSQQWRSSYYDQSGYRPMGAGAGAGILGASYFDAADRQGFKARPGAEHELDAQDDVGSAGFSDS